MSTLNVPTLRSDFPMLHRPMHGKPLIYFDTAATAQKPQAVIDAMTTFYTQEYGTVHRAVYDLAVNSSQLYEQARDQVRRFIGAKEREEVIFTRGTTASINLLAYSFGKAFIQAGDEILISEMEHHANIVPWQILCEDHGATLKVIPINDRGEIDLDAYATLLTKKTKLVSVVHISNALGTINPIKKMAEMAHAVGAKFAADGAQAVPSMPVDVQALGVDFYSFSAHKMYGPTGIGIFYGRRELLEEMPPYQGGGDMIDTVTFEKTTYAPLPLKFEAGTPSIAEVVGLGATIEYLEAIGMDRVHAHKQTLLKHGTEVLSAIPGVKIIGTAEHKSALFSFTVEGVHALDLGTMLDLKGVAIRTGHHCAQPTMRRFGVTAMARASMGLYNTNEELDRFAGILSEVIALLK